jgi:hypothetical protein
MPAADKGEALAKFEDQRSDMLEQAPTPLFIVRLYPPQQVPHGEELLVTGNLLFAAVKQGEPAAFGSH